MRVMLRRCAGVVAIAMSVLTALSAVSYAQSGSPNPMRVFVTNTSDDPVPVAGNVQVSNLPATQKIDGSVSVRNLPATQKVTGTIGIDPNANAVSVDLSDAQIETTAPETAVLLDEVVTLEPPCTFCGTFETFYESRSFPVASAGRVHMMVYGSPCGDFCPGVQVYSESPSNHSFLLERMDAGNGITDRALLEVPGTTVRVEIAYTEASAGTKVHLYAVGRS